VVVHVLEGERGAPGFATMAATTASIQRGLAGLMPKRGAFPHAHDGGFRAPPPLAGTRRLTAVLIMSFLRSTTVR